MSKLNEHDMNIVRDAARRFFEALDNSGYAEKSKDNYRRQVGHFIRWLEGDFQLKRPSHR